MMAGLQNLTKEFPIWGTFLATASIALLSIECGSQLGKAYHSPTREQEALVRTMVGAAIGLLTFTLVFTFWIAAAHFDGARDAILDEAAAVQTAYLRADMLPRPYRDEIRGLLRQYVDVRLGGVQSGNILPSIARAGDVQQLLWSRTIAAKVKTADPAFDGYLTQALGPFIALHTKRVAVHREFGIPNMVWAALYVITALAMMSIGCHAKLTEMSRSPVIPSVVLILSVLMVLIADLDHPQIGGLQVSQGALIELRDVMAASTD